MRSSVGIHNPFTPYKFMLNGTLSMAIVAVALKHRTDIAKAS